MAIQYYVNVKNQAGEFVLHRIFKGLDNARNEARALSVNGEALVLAVRSRDVLGERKAHFINGEEQS